ncbi:DUF885 family protein [Chitinophagaceae bacterium LWZ2-11]
MKLKLQLLLIISCFVCLSGIAQNASVSMQDFINTYNADVNGLEKVYVVKDNDEYYQRMVKYNKDYSAKLNALNFDKLNISDQVDYILLKRNINAALEDLNESKLLHDSVAKYIPFEKSITILQLQRRKGTHPDAAKAAELLVGIKNDANTVRKQNDIGSLSPALLKYAIKSTDRLRKTLQETVGFYKGYDPDFTWWTKKPAGEADSLLVLYQKTLEVQLASKPGAKDASGIKGEPIGSSALTHLLQYEMIPYTPEELVDIANREFAWCDAEMLKVSKEMGFGTDWKKALEKVKQHYVEPGMQPELINRLAEQAIRYVDSANLVTVPDLAKETWRMFMLTPEQQRFAPFFLGGESILIAYPTDDMDEETKMMSMRSNNYGFAHATVFHELIPGHNLQGFMNQRNKSYRRVFNTPFSVEGWALYWEMLLWDKGFHQTPEEKVGALFWRMHRCARIIFSLNYHLGKWTPQQCIDFLVERVGHERFSAESEVRRSFEGNYGPLYQIAYMMGGLQIRALHKELVDGKKMTDKQFHDAFLKENTIPIEMFRAIILNQKLSKDFTTQWKFAGELKP